MKMKALVNTGVFSRTGSDTMSTRAFFFVMAACVVYGLGGTAFLANASAGMQMNWGILLIAGLVVPIIGIIIAVKSDNPMFSFIGYNMVCLPFGLVLGPVVNQYSPDLIFRAALTTMEVTVVMGATGVLFPKFYSKIGGALFMALLGLLVVRAVQLFIPGSEGMGWVDWIAAGIFSLYIGYDMYRATMVPKTLDNAVDIALDLYLDIINLFLNLLKIYADSQK